MGLDRFAVENVDGEMWCVDRRPDPNDFPELTETTFGFMVCGSRVAAPSTWLKEMHVTHDPPPHAGEYERIYGAPVRFGARWNALRIDRSLIGTPVNVQPRFIFGVLSRHADALLSDLESMRTVRADVERALMHSLHTGGASVEHVATALGLSRQTLYRRLRAEGTTFDRVLDSLRRRLAEAYLGNDRLSVHEIALLVGYSEPAAFSRAFKRWTGLNPREARRSGRHAEGSPPLTRHRE
jgi:AraC-like DNA-binding protein